MHQEKHVLWVASGAQELMDDHLRDGTIPLNRKLMTPPVAYQLSELYKAFDYVYFRNKLCQARNKCKERGDWAKEDDTDLTHDYKIYPTQSYNAQGKPRWEGSDAEYFLKRDLKKYLKNKSKGMKPRDLYKKRPEYHKVFGLKTFRNHIYQEIKTRKFKNYVKAKKEAKKKKMMKKAGLMDDEDKDGSAEVFFDLTANASNSDSDED